MNRCRAFKWNGMLKNQRGFTLGESLMALLFSTSFLIVILLVVTVGFSKVGVLEADGHVIRFEQNIVRFLESDYREHRVVEIREGDTADVKLYLSVVDGGGNPIDIRYENRDNGFYRVYGNKSYLVSSHYVNEIQVEGKKLTVGYSIGEYDKSIVLNLVK